jgi:hypothetical protein
VPQIRLTIRGRTRVLDQLATSIRARVVAMRDDYKIYVDAGRPATLNDGAGRSFYYEEEPGPRSAAKLLARDEAFVVLIQLQ